MLLVLELDGWEEKKGGMLEVYILEDTNRMEILLEMNNISHGWRIRKIGRVNGKFTK